RKTAMSCTEYWEDAEHLAHNQAEYKKFKTQEQKIIDASDNEQHSDSATSTTGKKRGRGANAPATNKKHKIAGRHDSPTGAAGDKTRVPSQGQKVQWQSVAGYITGEVVEVLYEDKKVDGKSVKATKEDPRVVLKSDASGKTIVHKPEVVYW
ncbi:hypothetical protein P153DRAFT_268250, partial [Dothidotthia symphoricarpi CBS 119687]